MKFPIIKILLVAAVLLIASLACNLPSRESSRPPTAAPMSDEELQQLEKSMKETLAASSGEITVTLTEQQLNSILTTAITKQSEQIISETAVRLTNGTMEVYGKVNQDPITLDLKIVLKPGIDALGNPFLVVEDITMGGLPVPGELKERVGSLVDRAFQEYLSSQGQGFKASNIMIYEGIMTVTGLIQQP